jgi:hypothetical protein
MNACATLHPAGRFFVCRALDVVAVKGKDLAIRVYELVAHVETASPDQVGYGPNRKAGLFWIGVVFSVTLTCHCPTLLLSCCLHGLFL